MPDLQPVDGDPFTGASLQPINGDPWSSGAGGPMTDADYARGSQIGSELASTWPVRTAQGIWGGITAPGDVMQGKLDLNSPEAPGRVFNTATLAMTGGLLAAPEADAAGSVLGSGPIVAYHGSPHDFDAFDTSKIGTGEGAQAYGHGLYFAGNEGVARSYRDNLVFDPKNEVNDIISEGAKYPWQDQDSFVRDKLSLTPGMQDHATEENIGLIKRAIAGQEAGGTVTPDAMSAYRQLTNNIPPNPGKMYQVAINADPNHFLDWDKPQNAQPQRVQDALENLGIKTDPADKFWMNTAANQLAEKDDSWSTAAGSRNVTIKLAEAGIPGIKYLDAGSRGGGVAGQRAAQAIAERDGFQKMLADTQTQMASAPAEHQASYQLQIDDLNKSLAAANEKVAQAQSSVPAPTSNYVVFDDKTIQILKKYGIGGLGIGTAAGLKHFQTQPVQGDPYSNQNPGGVI